MNGPGSDGETRGSVLLVGRGAGSGPLPGPGGFRLLARALTLAALPKRARVLDVGCGTGEAVRYMREALGLKAIGIDRASAPSFPKSGVRADGCMLPVRDRAVDAVLLSCVLSAAADPGGILVESARVLVPGGRLIVLDLFGRAREEEARHAEAGKVPVPGWLGGVGVQGFEMLAWEDHSAVLREYVARYVLEEGPVANLLERIAASGGNFCRGAGSEGPLKLGYCLLVARRTS